MDQRQGPGPDNRDPFGDKGPAQEGPNNESNTIETKAETTPVTVDTVDTGPFSFSDWWGNKKAEYGISTFGDLFNTGLSSANASLAFDPVYAGISSLLHMGNFNPYKDEEGTVHPSNLGLLSDSTFGEVNPDNYSPLDDMSNVPPSIRSLSPEDLSERFESGFYGNAFNFDENDIFTKTDFGKIKDYADAHGMSYTGPNMKDMAAGVAGPGSDLSHATRENSDPNIPDYEAQMQQIQISGLTATQKGAYDNLLSMGYDHKYAMEYLKAA